MIFDSLKLILAEPQSKFGREALRYKDDAEFMRAGNFCMKRLDKIVFWTRCDDCVGLLPTGYWAPFRSRDPHANFPLRFRSRPRRG